MESDNHISHSIQFEIRTTVFTLNPICSPVTMAKFILLVSVAMMVLTMVGQLVAGPVPLLPAGALNDGSLNNPGF